MSKVLLAAVGLVGAYYLYQKTMEAQNQKVPSKTPSWLDLVQTRSSAGDLQNRTAIPQTSEFGNTYDQIPVVTPTSQAWKLSNQAPQAKTPVLV